MGLAFPRDTSLRASMAADKRSAVLSFMTPSPCPRHVKRAALAEGEGNGFAGHGLVVLCHPYITTRYYRVRCLTLCLPRRSEALPLKK
jgi:hypothetical protein